MVGAVALGREKEGIDAAGAAEWERTEMPAALDFFFLGTAPALPVPWFLTVGCVRQYVPLQRVNFCGNFILQVEQRTI